MFMILFITLTELGVSHGVCTVKAQFGVYRAHRDDVSGSSCLSGPLHQRAATAALNS
jgi:hypothetical protein